VTPELAQAIQAAVQAPDADAYRIARLSRFCGRWIRHSGWWPDYVVRLFRRDAGRFTDAAVHERVQVRGRTGTLRGHFLHDPYASLEVFIDKINRYSTEAARSAFERGRRTSVLGPFGHAAWTFIRHYILRRGFLDGWQGLVLAAMAATGSFYRYVKLYRLGRVMQASRGVTLHVLGAVSGLSYNPPLTIILLYRQIGEACARGTPYRGLTVHPRDCRRQMLWLRRPGYRCLSMARP